MQQRLVLCSGLQWGLQRQGGPHVPRSATPVGVWFGVLGLGVDGGPGGRALACRDGCDADGGLSVPNRRRVAAASARSSSVTCLVEVRCPHTGPVSSAATSRGSMRDLGREALCRSIERLDAGVCQIDCVERPWWSSGRRGTSNHLGVQHFAFDPEGEGDAFGRQSVLQRSAESHESWRKHAGDCVAGEGSRPEAGRTDDTGC